jgi:hypothetical protein
MNAMNTKTTLLEYACEAEANGRSNPLRTQIKGEATCPDVMKKALAFAALWNVSPDTLEVIEVTDEGGDDECYDQRGNLSDCAELVGLRSAHR